VPAPETVTDALAFLATEGYVDELRLCSGGIARQHDDDGDVHPVDDAVVDFTFRFEGPSDPADEAIVLGLRCPRWGAKGVIVSAYGHDAGPEEAALLRTLAGRRP
jgi:hypothetical protein